MLSWGLLFSLSFMQVLLTNCGIAPGVCNPPNAKFVAGRNCQPRDQWTISGGFCGSVSIQTIALSYGVWISQDLIRKAAPGYYNMYLDTLLIYMCLYRSCWTWESD